MQTLRNNVINHLKAFFDNSYARERFVKNELSKLNSGQSLLDAGCGDQKYRQYCDHLVYLSQDFGGYTVDSKKMMGNEGLGGTQGYKYGPLDYVGNIWEIDSPSDFFDSVLCTEVLEHVPYPIDTVHELSRILKPGGRLILTAPSNCLRHMDPFYFSSGFSDRCFEQILSESGFEIEVLKPVGDYFRWMAVEILRTIRTNRFASVFLIPSLIYFSTKKSTPSSQDQLCMGYHVVAVKS